MIISYLNLLCDNCFKHALDLCSSVSSPVRPKQINEPSCDRTSRQVGAHRWGSLFSFCHFLIHVAQSSVCWPSKTQFLGQRLNSIG